jgi:competence ComEA-like helix-hairpin-helix protein
MRLVAHLAPVTALVTIGLGLGRWLRDPNPGGLVFLLLVCALVAVAVRQLYASPEPVRAAPRPRPEPSSEPEPEPPLWDHRIDLNAASHDDLQRLPGVGPVAAQRIVAEREANGPFASVEDLVRVPGFGPGKVRVLAPDARV